MNRSWSRKLRLRAAAGLPANSPASGRSIRYVPRNDHTDQSPPHPKRILAHCGRIAAGRPSHHDTFPALCQALIGASCQRLAHTLSLRFQAFLSICYDSCMGKAAVFSIALVLCALSLASAAPAQSTTGTLEFMARITPTAARPEPVRQFTFYILTKSYAEIVKEVEEKDKIPPRDEFIDSLKLSPELRAWLKSHDIFDLTLPGVDQAMTPDDIIHIPEFLLAYQRSNSGGVTSGKIGRAS